MLRGLVKTSDRWKLGQVSNIIIYIYPCIYHRISAIVVTLNEYAAATFIKDARLFILGYPPSIWNSQSTLGVWTTVVCYIW